MLRAVSGRLLKRLVWDWTALRRRGVEANAAACAIVATKSRSLFFLVVSICRSSILMLVLLNDVVHLMVPEDTPIRTNT
jgi:hypothetical protein